MYNDLNLCNRRKGTFIKNNFTQALKELTGFDEENTKPDMNFDASQNTQEIIPEIYDEMGVIGSSTKNCSNLFLETGTLTGDILSDNLVSINEGVSMTGSIVCRDITVVGTVLGNISSSGKVGLASTAVVKSDIKAAEMGMEMGAKLDGKVSII